MDSSTVHCVVYTGLSLCESWTVQQFIVLFTLVSLCVYHGQSNSSLCCLHWSLFVRIMDSPTVHCVVYTGLSLCVSWTVQQFIVLFTLVSLCLYHGQSNSSLCCLHWSLFVRIMDSSTVHCVVYTGLSLSVSWTVQQFIVLFTLVSLCAHHGQSNNGHPRFRFPGRSIIGILRTIYPSYFILTIQTTSVLPLVFYLQTVLPALSNVLISDLIHSCHS